MKPLTVLSLFDGISCGQQAFKELKIPIKKYYASEIHIPSMQVTKNNFPDTKFIGDVTMVKAKYLDKIDIIIGGSPCQGFSFNGKGLNFDDPRSKLFFEFVRLLKEARKINPKVLFFLENVKMKKEHEHVISKALGIEPIYIDSQIFGAQMRKRLYWTNIKVMEKLPKSNPLVLKDVLLQIPEFKENDKRNRRGYDKFASQNVVLPLNKKTPCLINSSFFIATTFKQCRLLHPIEWERLQGLPDNYTSNISHAGRYMSIANGWHVPTIKFLFKHILK